MRFFLPLLVAACASGGTATPPARGGDSVESRAESEWTSERRTYRKAVGGLGAGYLYQTHMMIGAMADLFQKGSLGAQELVALMETTLGLQENVSEVLMEVRRAGLSPNDLAVLDRMLEVNRLVSEQARALRRIAEARTDENLRAFVEHRKATWDRLGKLLNIPQRPLEEEGKVPPP